MEPDQQYLKTIVQGLVDFPDEVEVERGKDDMGILLTLKVNPQDMGKVIGRGGATINAIRPLLGIFGVIRKARISVQVAEPEGNNY